jgi:hypothetical protein
MVDRFIAQRGRSKSAGEGDSAQRARFKLQEHLEKIKSENVDTVSPVPEDVNLYGSG